MSIQAYRERVQQMIDEKIEATLAQHLRLNKIYQAQAVPDAGVAPALSPEIIGMCAIENCAKIDAYKQAREFLDDVFKELTAPREEREEDGDGDTEESERGGYG